MSAVDTIMRACELSWWDGSPDRCRWCDRSLPQFRRVWCSAACSNQYVVNHVWPIAKDAARERDKGCVDCAVSPADNPGLTEVHHLAAVNGDRRQGCQHHLDQLVLLCRAHHLERHRAAG